MNVTKQQIVNGIIKYTKNEVISKITNKAFKIAMAVGVSMLETNTEIADKFFENDVISAILGKNDEGSYDIDKIAEALERTLNEYGDFPITIPPIKFISSSEQALNFSSRDVKTLKEYISGGVSV